MTPLIEWAIKASVLAVVALVASACARRQSAAVISSTPPVGPAMPALLTRRSRPPSPSRTASNSAATSASLATSAWLAPWPGWARRKSSSAASATSQMWTRAPCAISWSAIARPMPEAPAVTSARRPATAPAAKLWLMERSSSRKGKARYWATEQHAGGS